MITRVIHRELCSISSDTINKQLINYNGLFSSANEILFQERTKKLKRIRPPSKNEIKNKPLSSQSASVLVPLIMVDNQPALLFTERSRTLKTHAGEVCYPGGKFDSRYDENLTNTALRETEEELGIDRNLFQIWETLPPLKSRNGKSLITPVVALLKEPFLSSNLKVNADEVSKVFTCTIAEMCNQKYQGYTQFRSGYTLPVYHGIHLSEKPKIWGLTAIITHQVLSALTPENYKLKLQYVHPYKSK